MEEIPPYCFAVALCWVNCFRDIWNIFAFSIFLYTEIAKLVNIFPSGRQWTSHLTVYPKKYAHGFCFAVLCCGYTLTDFSISIRLTSLALWQSNDCPSASKTTLMNMDKYFMWIHYERLHNHNKAKHNKTVCIFLGIYCTYWQHDCWWTGDARSNGVWPNSSRLFKTRHQKATQQTHYAIMTSLLRQTTSFCRNYVKMTSFWRNNDVIITSCVQWVSLRMDW